MHDRDGRARQKSARFIAHRTTDIGAERLAERRQCDEQSDTPRAALLMSIYISVLSSKFRFPGGGKRYGYELTLIMYVRPSTTDALTDLVEYSFGAPA